ACPALGCEAAPNQATGFYLKLGDAFIGAASPPSAGQARSLQGYFSVVESCVDTYGYRRQASSHRDKHFKVG
ncbi:hypothetical protein, partial [Pseudomonas cedrina]|uniref:hypothetical protein n=1 Tax=Pseudomonas cedrina TaxID=651740 RepID=UPI001B808B80